MGNPGPVKAVFLQARLGSTRLPGKAVLKIKDKTIFEHAMISLKKIKAEHYVVLSDEKSADALNVFAEPCGFDIFPGSPDNVLKRFYDASEKYKPDYIIRATADNPLVSWEMAESILGYLVKNNLDYAAYSGLPLGCGVESFKKSALDLAYEKADDPYEKEHVTPYIYYHPELFKMERPELDASLTCPDFRVTLDTVEDFKTISKVFDALYNNETISYKDLIQWIIKHTQ